MAALAVGALLGWGSSGPDPQLSWHPDLRTVRSEKW